MQFRQLRPRRFQRLAFALFSSTKLIQLLFQRFTGFGCLIRLGINSGHFLPHGFHGFFVAPVIVLGLLNSRFPVRQRRLQLAQLVPRLFQLFRFGIALLTQFGEFLIQQCFCMHRTVGTLLQRAHFTFQLRDMACLFRKFGFSFRHLSLPRLQAFLHFIQVDVGFLQRRASGPFFLSQIGQLIQKFCLLMGGLFLLCQQLLKPCFQF